MDHFLKGGDVTMYLYLLLAVLIVSLIVFLLIKYYLESKLPYKVKDLVKVKIRDEKGKVV